MKNKNLALVAVLFTISVIMAFANGPTPQVVIDTDQIIDGAVDIIKTTGIADTSLSNVVPATGRAALELGTMAVATATDYVATDTFTGHTGATGASVHGLGTIATVDSPVPIANGGTGATTAAAGLAALGGASLNGSSTVDFAAQRGTFASVANGLSTDFTITYPNTYAGQTSIATITLDIPHGKPVLAELSFVAGNNIIKPTHKKYLVSFSSNYGILGEFVVSEIVAAGANTADFAVGVSAAAKNKINITVTNNAAGDGMFNPAITIKLLNVTPAGTLVE